MSLMDEWSTRRRMDPVALALGATIAIVGGVWLWGALDGSDSRPETALTLEPAAGAVDDSDTRTDTAGGLSQLAENGSDQPDPVALIVGADAEAEQTSSTTDSSATSGSTSTSTVATSATTALRTATARETATTRETAATGGTTTARGATTTSGTTSTMPSVSTTSSTAASTTRTSTTQVATTAVSTTPQPTPGGSGYRTCRVPAGGSTRSVDFDALRRSGAAVSELNQSGSLLRTVFELGSDRMAWGSEGLELKIDLSDPAATNNRYRAEIRESVIDEPIPVGSIQAYCMRFRVDELPDLYGPVKIFQRFNRNLDGPDIGVELTGANQFSNAVPNDIQVVAWDGRNRIGAQLAAVNTLLVVVHNDATNGSYKVVLNGRVLREQSGLNTVGAAAGGWSQFGIYPHGLYDNDGSNRQDQIDSGRTRVRFQYRDFTLTDYNSGSSNLSGFSVD